ncbi:hypothetical protein H8S95_01590 [Pontibacter sp. KCTC 32443]|uniref:bestrophin-like domain n=1 Tax=Pontibacter TaxID=323449 RepID=UPI00164E9795|nr:MULTISPECIES: hypothetical protein [Pontibacter]MBC5772742.1 hypothetical protein [Pontibacter sp. KCTC 32443]
MKDNSIFYATDLWLIMLLLFVMLVVATYVGMHVGLIRKPYATATDEHSVVIASVLGLQGLLLAFTFAMAGSRFEARRQSISDENTGIRTVIMMADLYEPAERQEFRKEIKAYLDTRIKYYEMDFKPTLLAATREKSRLLILTIWKRAVRLSRNPDNQLASEQMIPALHELLKVQEARHTAVRDRVPDPIVYMLFILSLATAFFAGYAGIGRKRRDWLAILIFHFLVAIVIYITLVLDRPRRGIIKLNDMHQMTVELRKFYKEAL